MECTGFDGARGALFDDLEIFFIRTSNAFPEEDCNVKGKRLGWHQSVEFFGLPFSLSPAALLP